jgi:hypothetical protein
MPYLLMHTGMILVQGATDLIVILCESTSLSFHTDFYVCAPEADYI